MLVNVNNFFFCVPTTDATTILPGRQKGRGFSELENGTKFDHKEVGGTMEIPEHINRCYVLQPMIHSEWVGGWQ